MSVARRLYETTAIINAAIEDEDIRATIDRLKEYIESHGGEILLMTEWGPAASSAGRAGHPCGIQTCRASCR